MLVRLLVFFAIGLIFSASQLFWIRRVRALGKRLIASATWRKRVGLTGLGAYILLFAYNFIWAQRARSPTHLTLQAALLEAPLLWWVASSLLGFGVVVLFWICARLAGAIRWGYTGVMGGARPDPPSPARRRFLEQTALAAAASPFVAGAYGLLYGRLNLQTSYKRITLRRCPKHFAGFRIAQLSDLHIGPFMSAEEIRKVVALANELRPELVVLTGDYVTWDPTTQEAVVSALAGIKAPFGVFGCLGNHELWTDTEGSITRLFAAEGIRILRRARVPISSGSDQLNLIGVDFQSRRVQGGPYGEGFVRAYLEGVEELVMPDTLNILLSHNPNTFDRAAELGIDLSLSGHTHGGQVALEFVHRNISPSRLITPYVKGWFEKSGAQLYVNRGIGTIGVPIRLNAPPEITLFELARGA